jgi:peptide/nickel transport system permease protein
MGRVVLSRLASAVPLLVATTLLSFLLVHWAPGSFLDQLRFQPGIPESVIDHLEERYGLDRPWHQYCSWLFGVARGAASLRFGGLIPRTLVFALLFGMLAAALGLLGAKARPRLGSHRLPRGLTSFRCAVILPSSA